MYPIAYNASWVYLSTVLEELEDLAK